MNGWKNVWIGGDHVINGSLPKYKWNRKGPTQPLGNRVEISIQALSEVKERFGNSFVPRVRKARLTSSDVCRDKAESFHWLRTSALSYETPVDLQARLCDLLVAGHSLVSCKWSHHLINVQRCDSWGGFRDSITLTFKIHLQMRVPAQCSAMRSSMENPWGKKPFSII